MSIVSCLPQIVICETENSNLFYDPVECGWETIERLKIKIPRKLETIHEIKKIETTVKDTVPVFTSHNYTLVGVLCQHNIFYEDKEGKLIQYEKQIAFCEKIRHTERSYSMPETIAYIGEQDYRLCNKRKIELSLLVEILLW